MTATRVLSQKGAVVPLKRTDVGSPLGPLPIRVVDEALFPRRVDRQTTANGVEYDHKFIGSTELLASDHGVIYVDGWRWDRYMKRPRWIANHDLGGWSGKITEVSLGRGVAVAVEEGLPTERVGPSGKAMCVYVRYARTEFAQEVRALYDEGGLDDVSVRWDWRTEVTRNPYEEEVQKYGEDLYWVCERADLVELSAVLLGADAGAQMVRSDVLEAFERCRSKRLALPEVERFIRQRTAPIVPVRRREDPKPDALAAAAPVAGIQTDVTLLAERLEDMQKLRQQITDNVTLLRNLADATAGAEADDDAAPSAMAVALATFNDQLTDFEIATDSLGTAIAGMRDAVPGVAEAFGLADVPGVQIARVLADRGSPLEQLEKAFGALP